ncbi:MAG: polymer-forming cytoskeletal protein [Flavobacteriaceae bacterium]|nr:polymer-forming cytoskeletal protein [Flavobacteriaceae bacterium]
MFSDNKKRKMTTDNTSQQNIIAQGTKVVGDITSKGAFRIDGTIQGTLKTPGKIVVGKTGIINGTLDGANADFEGKFSGKLKLSGTLTLKTSAHIEGEVEVGKLAVEPGATFNAVCSMKGAVKELNKGEQQQQKPRAETERTA